MSECPYRCNEGYVLIESMGQRVPCPHCNGIERYVEMTNTENPNNVYNVLKIPLQYRQLTGDSSEGLISAIATTSVGGNGAVEVAELMTNISKSLDKKQVYRMSAYIHVPASLSGLDINEFVYSMQIKALQRGVGTMPYITANTLNLLLRGQTLPPDENIEPLKNRVIDGTTGRTHSLRARMKYACDFDYMDYITTPLVFIEVSAGIDDTGWIAIADLLCERCKLSLPTYVIGYWSRYSTKTGVYVFDDQMHRLDKLTDFEFRLNSSKTNGVRKLRAVESRDLDSLNENGVKSKGYTEPEAIDYEKLI